MSLSRREFLEMLAAATAAGFGLTACDDKKTAGGKATGSADPYEVPTFGNVSLLHFTDCHAQLMPIYFREPSINIGVGQATGKPPHVVGEALLKHFNIPAGSADAHAFTYLDFTEAARKYGKVGGFAHLATLVKKLRAQRPNRVLLLDSGDTWQGSATALWTQGQDMVDATKLLGVDIMTGHWEFTYGAARVKDIVDKELKGKIEFVAQNVADVNWGDLIFKPYTMREINGVPVAIIGQAFPYTPIANNRFAFPDWTFGINDERMQKTINEVRGKGAQVVVILSHNGTDVDLKMASRLHGADVILGGHTHDAMPAPSIVADAGGGKTLVINSGSNSKFLSVLDLEVKGGKVTDFRYKLLPVFANLLPADKDMAAYLEKMRAPYKDKLAEKLAVTDSLLYRRGNFNGTFDQMICDAMLAVQGAEIAFSPGFRWGTTVLPGDAITMEHLMDQTAITYGTATLNELSGEQIKVILEDIADNLFNPDPYLQQGGDMVRVGGLTYTMDIKGTHGTRINDMAVNGKPLAADKKYKVAGWASVQEQPPGQKQIWDVVGEYLRNKKTVRIDKPYTPKLKGVKGNPGIAGVTDLS